jgi:Tfp pilus assembly protein PilV
MQSMNSQAGFTLIETTMSMVLMTIIGLGVVGLFAYAASNTSNAADREMATAVAQQRMEQLRSFPFLDPSLAATASTGTVTSVTRLGRQYTVTTTIVDSANGTSKTITVKVTPQGASATWATSVNSIFGSVTLVTVRSALQIGPNRAL